MPTNEGNNRTSSSGSGSSGSGSFGTGNFGSSRVTPEELLEKLRTALSRDGDFPASAKIVTELRQLTSDPKTTANLVSEVILREPSLGTRVLHLVNSAFYRRSKPIMTVSQAVIQIGMKPLAEMCAGLILLQKFVPAARRGGSFAMCLRKTVLTALLAGTLSSQCPNPAKKSKSEEFGYLAGSFSELGMLLLAFYFPQLFDAALKRSEQKNQHLTRSIEEITGLSPYKISIEVIEALNLPVFYRDILKVKIGEVPSSSDNSDVEHLARIVTGAGEISSVLSGPCEKAQLEAAVEKVRKDLKAPVGVIDKLIGDLPKLFADHCSSIDLQLPSLPEFVSKLAEAPAEPATNSEEAAASAALQSTCEDFLNEIRQAVEAREPTASIITSAMEMLAFGMKFDRVLLLLAAGARNRLTGRLLLGNRANFDPKQISRSVGPGAPKDAPDAAAFEKGYPITTGKPIIDDGKCFMVIPIGYGSRAIGVLYADQVPSGEKSLFEVTPEHEALAVRIADLIENSIVLNA